MVGKIPEMKSEWSNQRQETRGGSISHMKVLPGKLYMEVIGFLPRYNTNKWQPQSMSATLLGTCHKMSATVQIASFPGSCVGARAWE